jgi:hypothetical protein
VVGDVFTRTLGTIMDGTRNSGLMMVLGITVVVTIAFVVLSWVRKG